MNKTGKNLVKTPVVLEGERVKCPHCGKMVARAMRGASACGIELQCPRCRGMMDMAV